MMAYLLNPTPPGSFQAKTVVMCSANNCAGYCPKSTLILILNETVPFFLVKIAPECVILEKLLNHLIKNSYKTDSTYKRNSVCNILGRLL